MVDDGVQQGVGQVIQSDIADAAEAGADARAHRIEEIVVRFLLHARAPVFL